jgi:hypothetical protein
MSQNEIPVPRTDLDPVPPEVRAAARRLRTDAFGLVQAGLTIGEGFRRALGLPEAGSATAPQPSVLQATLSMQREAEKSPLGENLYGPQMLRLLLQLRPPRK